jgi:hypothetical protein
MGITAAVKHGDDDHLLSHDSIVDCEGKSLHLDAANISMDDSMQFRHPIDLLEGIFHGFQKLVTKPVTLFIVPGPSFGEIGLGLGSENHDGLPPR